MKSRLILPKEVPCEGKTPQRLYSPHQFICTASWTLTVVVSPGPAKTDNGKRQTVKNANSELVSDFFMVLSSVEDGNLVKNSSSDGSLSLRSN